METKLYLSLATACIRCTEILDWLTHRHGLDVRSVITEQWFPGVDGLVEAVDGEVLSSHNSPNSIVRTLYKYGLAPEELSSRNLSLEFLQEYKSDT